MASPTVACENLRIGSFWWCTQRLGEVFLQIEQELQNKTTSGPSSREYQSTTFNLNQSKDSIPSRKKVNADQGAGRTASEQAPRVAKRAGKGDLFSSYEWFEFFVGYQVKLFHEKIKVLVARVHVGLCADLCHLREVVVVYVHKYLMPAEGWRGGPHVGYQE